VLADGVVVGRIMKAAAAPVRNAVDVNAGLGHVRIARRRTATRATREAAMAAFAKSWRRE
jgi:hypothetical protein